jgi:hypothetical protein
MVQFIGLGGFEEFDVVVETVHLVFSLSYRQPYY